MVLTISEELCSLNIGNDESRIKEDSHKLDYDMHFMKIALVTAMRSKDPCKQVGCVIADENNCVVSMGYNGFPVGCDDDILPWTKDDKDFLNNKHAYVVHAEMNALTNKRRHTLHGCTVYVTLFPCNECAKLLIQSRVKRIVYFEDKDSEKYHASRLMFDMAGIEYTRYKMRNKTIRIDV